MDFSAGQENETCVAIRSVHIAAAMFFVVATATTTAAAVAIAAHIMFTIHKECKSRNRIDRR